MIVYLVIGSISLLIGWCAGGLLKEGRRDDIMPCVAAGTLLALFVILASRGIWHR